jgi:uncharacterized RDD family membrane protein YckC
VAGGQAALTREERRVEYEDRITVWAPEGLALEYTLAGLGSRFLADLVDVVLRLIVLAAVIGLLTALGASRAVLLIALLIGGFLALFGYDIAFEVWGAGRTPGKRWNGLRVLMADGQPVAFGPSAVRNLMRIVDIWATAMLAGSISIIVTKHNQRLGDLAAGTIVVRERRGSSGRTSSAMGAPATAQGDAVPAGLDVTAITPAELSTIREFLARRERLTKEARARVAATLAASLSGKVGGITPGQLPPERLLETIAAAKSASGYGSPPPR